MSQNEKGYRNEDRNQTNYLSRPFTFKGKAWDQRDIEIPAEWASRKVSLHLERTKLTSVWLDENFIGHQDGLGSEQVYQLSDHLSPGSHVLTICVDNQEKA